MTEKTWKSTNIVFILAKEIQRNFCMCNLNLSKCHYDMLKLNTLCVGMCVCSGMTIMVRQVYFTLMNILQKFLLSPNLHIIPMDCPLNPP